MLHTPWKPPAVMYSTMSKQKKSMQGERGSKGVGSSSNEQLHCTINMIVSLHSWSSHNLWHTVQRDVLPLLLLLCNWSHYIAVSRLKGCQELSTLRPFAQFTSKSRWLHQGYVKVYRLHITFFSLVLSLILIKNI